MRGSSVFLWPVPLEDRLEGGAGLEGRAGLDGRGAARGQGQGSRTGAGLEGRGGARGEGRGSRSGAGLEVGGAGLEWRGGARGEGRGSWGGAGLEGGRRARGEGAGLEGRGGEEAHPLVSYAVAFLCFISSRSFGGRRWDTLPYHGYSCHCCLRKHLRAFSPGGFKSIWSYHERCLTRAYGYECKG